MNSNVAVDPIERSWTTMCGNALVVRKQLVKTLIQYSTMNVTAKVTSAKINVEHAARTIS